VPILVKIDQEMRP